MKVLLFILSSHGHGLWVSSVSEMSSLELCETARKSLTQFNYTDLDIDRYSKCVVVE